MSKFPTVSFNYIRNDSTTDIGALEKRGYNVYDKKIGEGAYSTVMESFYLDDAGFKLRLACKVMKPRKKNLEDDKFISRELDILKTLHHDNIIQVHSIVQFDRKIFVFMQLAENGDLLKYIAKSGPLKEVRAKVWFWQIAQALEYLHSRGLAHRDMKCENILITKVLNVKLSDFGFSCYCQEKCGKNVKCDSYLGSEAYVAPEVMHFRPYDPQQADTWGLGVILFMMLNGIFPFDITNTTKLFIQKETKDYAFGRQQERYLSDNAKATVAALLEPEPQERWNIHDILNCSWLGNPME